MRCFSFVLVIGLLATSSAGAQDKGISTWARQRMQNLKRAFNPIYQARMALYGTPTGSAKGFLGYKTLGIGSAHGFFKAQALSLMYAHSYGEAPYLRLPTTKQLNAARKKTHELLQQADARATTRAGELSEPGNGRGLRSPMDRMLGRTGKEPPHPGAVATFRDARYMAMMAARQQVIQRSPPHAAFHPPAM